MTDFTFSAVTGQPGGDSPWYDTSEIIDKWSYLVTGVFVGTMVLRYSNNETFGAGKGADYVTDPQVHVGVDGPREIEPGSSKRIQFGMSAYTSGSPKVSLMKARTTNDGKRQEISPETNKTPAPSSASS